jgi:hypothetical protein
MIPILRKRYRSLYSCYAAVCQPNTKGERLIDAVALLGRQALQFVGDHGGIRLDEALYVALGLLDRLLAGLDLLQFGAGLLLLGLKSSCALLAAPLLQRALEVEV